MSDLSLINIGELSKPATILIEKISDAVGGIFKPYQIVRVAKAEVAAEQMRAESQIQISDLQRRAMHRFLEEEAKKQSNIEGITQQALPHLEEKSSPENIEDDWITNFFDKCRIISDLEMQSLWSHVLASEANSPGAFSKRTVNLLADLDKKDAELFCRLCGFGWMIGNVVPLIFDVKADIYNQQGINFSTISHLESLGLVQFNSLSGFSRLGLPKQFNVFYYGRSVELSFPKDVDNELNLGNVLLTRAGQELAPICGSSVVNGFFEHVYDKWSDLLYVPKRTTEQPIDIAANRVESGE